MLRWNTCPRCKGDVRLDRDEYGWYEECLMCGYLHDVPGTVGNGRHSPEGRSHDKVLVRAKHGAR